jgi:hypothetical protein
VQNTPGQPGKDCEAYDHLPIASLPHVRGQRQVRACPASTFLHSQGRAALQPALMPPSTGTCARATHRALRPPKGNRDRCVHSLLHPGNAGLGLGGDSRDNWGGGGWLTGLARRGDRGGIHTRLGAALICAGDRGARRGPLIGHQCEVRTRARHRDRARANSVCVLPGRTHHSPPKPLLQPPSSRQILAKPRVRCA